LSGPDNAGLSTFRPAQPPARHRRVRHRQRLAVSPRFHQLGAHSSRSRRGCDIANISWTRRGLK